MLDVVPPSGMGKLIKVCRLLLQKTKPAIVCALLSDMFVPSSVCGFCLVRFVIF